jgi:molybdopterin synthase catalytic subunit
VDFDSLVDNSRRRVLGHARCQVIHVTVVVVAIEMMSRQLMEPVAIVTLHRVQNMRGGQVNLVLIVMSARRRAALRGDRWLCH